MVAEPHNPAPTTPPDPATIPRLQPLPPEEARLLNAFLFTHDRDHSAAAAAFNTSEVELMLFLDQPHITPYLQRFAANRRDQRTDRAAAKLDDLINRTTNDIELRRAITALFRFYQSPRPTSPRAIRIGAESPRPPPTPDADPDGSRAASHTDPGSTASRAIRIGSKDPRPHQAPDADPDGSGAPSAAAPGDASPDIASSESAPPSDAALQTATSPTRDHVTTRPRDHSPSDHVTTRPHDHSPSDHSDNTIINNLTPFIPRDPTERTVWLKRVTDKRLRWTRADQRQFESDVKAALAQAYADAREQGIDLEAHPQTAHFYTDSYIHRLRNDHLAPDRPP